MTNIGRTIRERRLMFPGTQVGLIVPIDHGLTAGPIAGLDTLPGISRWLASGDFSAILLHKGILEYLVTHRLLRSSLGVIVHLNGMSTLAEDADTKRMVTSIEAAVQLGADAVSLQVNFNQANFPHNLEMLGKVTDAAHSYGLPLLTMLYNALGSDEERHLEETNKLIRVAVELGTDLLKIGMPRSTQAAASIMSQFLGNTKIFFAGGAAENWQSFSQSVAGVLSQGCNGLCVGRNIFQAPEPNEMLTRLARMIKGYGAPEGGVLQHT